MWVGTTELLDGGATLRMVGNTWKKVVLNTPYTVTADTVLTVTFRSWRTGEIHGIGFDTDDGISANRTFKLYGTQNWGIQSYHRLRDWQRGDLRRSRWAASTRGPSRT